MDGGERSVRLLTRFRSRSGGRRGPRRRRVVPLWRTRTGRAVALVLGLAAIVGLPWWAWQSGTAEAVAESARNAAIGMTADLGLTIDEVYVVGRRETRRTDVLSALGVSRGSPILALDLGAARDRLMALPWVREASVERLLPDTVVVRISERQALALWQNRGAFAVIDHSGAVVEGGDPARFAHLLRVVGEDAPPHAAALIAVLEGQPELRRRVAAAVRVGGRRWNVRLAGGIDVRLPEHDAAQAWTRLAGYERAHQVLKRDIKVLDLRFDDQVIVRKNSTPPEQQAGKGQET